MLFSIVAAPVYIPTNSAQGFPFLYILTNICYFLSFDNSHSYRCEMTSHCGFDLHFPDDLDFKIFEIKNLICLVYCSAQDS